MDSGVDFSMVHQRVAKVVDANVTPQSQTLIEFGVEVRSIAL